MDFGLRKKTVPRKRPPVRKKIRSRALRQLINHKNGGTGAATFSLGGGPKKPVRRSGNPGPSSTVAGVLATRKPARKNNPAFENAARGRALGSAQRLLAHVSGARPNQTIPKRKCGAVGKSAREKRDTTTVVRSPQKKAAFARRSTGVNAAAITVAVHCTVQDLISRVEYSCLLEESTNALQNEMLAREACFSAELDALRESAFEAERRRDSELVVQGMKEAQATAATDIDMRVDGKDGAIAVQQRENRLLRTESEYCAYGTGRYGGALS